MNSEYLEYIKEYTSKIDFKRTSDDVFYFEKIYREISMKFESMYGFSYNEMDEAYIPGTLLGIGGRKFVAVFLIGIRNGGKNYGAVIFHPKYKLVWEDDIEEMLTEEEYKDIFPYKYRLAVRLLNDSAGNISERY
ncbi:hypothetical protein [Clostridium luticellarii]|uniref:Uncharacterized protein n=1 Tax=Clostridium luticellarii TaxID=1691940 RepID=A0A2T0B6Y3_9CLOT|nr:hypothetical protein [Clostridium luticellarii]PRR79651.1 hypothetical protein CLLU_34640 [Clostridium luticellarii]